MHQARILIHEMATRVLALRYKVVEKFCLNIHCHKSL